MRVFGIEFSGNPPAGKQSVNFSSRHKQEHRVRDVVDILAGSETILSPPLKNLKTPKYIDRNEILAPLQNSPIPYSAAAATKDTKGDLANQAPSSQQPQAMKTVSSSRRSAGFSSLQQNRKSKKFDELIKSRAEEAKAVRLLAENTAKNVSLPPPSLSATDAAMSLSSKTNIQDVNSKWQDMMIRPSPATSASTEGKKAKRSISFNEKVVCHNIQRVKDIIDEYDAFEREFLAECETRLSAMESSTNLVLGDRKRHISYDGHDSMSYNHMQMHGTSNSDAEFEMTLEEILSTQITIPDSLSRQDEIFRESRLRHQQHCEYYEDSVTSMAPACPTPDRSLSPSHNEYDHAGSVAHVSYTNHYSLDESIHDIHNIGREHLSELESLFSGGVHDAAHQTFAVPVISLVSNTQKQHGPASVFMMQFESDTTLSSPASQASSSRSKENSDIPPKKGFWTSLFSRVFKRQRFFSSTKVHPLL